MFLFFRLLCRYPACACPLPPYVPNVLFVSSSLTMSLLQYFVCCKNKKDPHYTVSSSLLLCCFLGLNIFLATTFSNTFSLSPPQYDRPSLVPTSNVGPHHNYGPNGSRRFLNSNCSLFLRDCDFYFLGLLPNVNAIQN
jgi:hypothetical protein